MREGRAVCIADMPSTVDDAKTLVPHLTHLLALLSPTMENIDRMRTSTHLYSNHLISLRPSLSMFPLANCARVLSLPASTADDAARRHTPSPQCK